MVVKKFILSWSIQVHKKVLQHLILIVWMQTMKTKKAKGFSVKSINISKNYKELLPSSIAERITNDSYYKIVNDVNAHKQREKSSNTRDHNENTLLFEY